MTGVQTCALPIYRLGRGFLGFPRPVAVADAGVQAAASGVGQRLAGAAGRCGRRQGQGVLPPVARDAAGDAGEIEANLVRLLPADMPPFPMTDGMQR